MITGISVEIKVGPVAYAPSKDPIYLGIYGKNGGREYALDVDNYDELDSPNKILKLKLGNGCCPQEGELQVRHSITSGGSNNPNIYPLEVEDVEYVYLRKYQRAQENSSNQNHHDDLLELSNVKVKLCDSHGGIRKFEKDIKMFFGYECGVQHWLVEGPRPGCLIFVQLDSVHYGGRNVGNKWKYRLDAGIGNIANQEVYSRGKHTFRLGQTQYPGARLKMFRQGCCGESFQIKLRAAATEFDWPGQDDDGHEDEEVQITCTEEKKSTAFKITFPVAGVGRRIAQLTFEGRIFTQCIGC